MLTVFSFDNDSNLNNEKGKDKLRQAGLNDELDVGRWIASRLQDCEQSDVSQNVIKFIEEKERSTLNSNRVSMRLLRNSLTEKITFEYIPGQNISLIEVEQFSQRNFLFSLCYIPHMGKRRSHVNFIGEVYRGGIAYRR